MPKVFLQKRVRKSAASAWATSLSEWSGQRFGAASLQKLEYAVLLREMSEEKRMNYLVVIAEQYRTLYA